MLQNPTLYHSFLLTKQIVCRVYYRKSTPALSPLYVLSYNNVMQTTETRCGGLPFILVVNRCVRGYIYGGIVAIHGGFIFGRVRCAGVHGGREGGSVQARCVPKKAQKARSGPQLYLFLGGCRWRQLRTK